jgi:hypothetical protein
MSTLFWIFLPFFKPYLGTLELKLLRTELPEGHGIARFSLQ